MRGGGSERERDFSRKGTQLQNVNFALIALNQDADSLMQIPIATHKLA